MATTIYLTNLASDVSGYKLALVNQRNPSPPSALATTVTNTTGSGTNIQQTLTAGGTVAKWITKPLAVAVTIASAAYVNIWGLESAAAANAGFQMRVAQYTTTIGSDLLTSSITTEAATSAGINQWITAGITSTAFAVGDRLAILPYIINIGTMGASQTVTMDYDGATANADGDTYILLQEDLRVNEAQVLSGSSPTVRGKSVSYFMELNKRLQEAVDGGLIAANCGVQQVIDECSFQASLV